MPEFAYDKELHKLCIEKKLNFGNNEQIVKEVSIKFSPEGVKEHQQYFHIESKDSFYGDDLVEFTKFMYKGVPWWKRML